MVAQEVALVQVQELELALVCQQPIQWRHSPMPAWAAAGSFVAVCVLRTKHGTLRLTHARGPKRTALMSLIHRHLPRSRSDSQPSLGTKSCAALYV